VDSETRSLRPIDDDDTPNANPPGVPPASVAKPDYTPGDPHGLMLEDGGPGARWPRSLLHAYQPLRGVITTNGGSVGSVPTISTTTLFAAVATRLRCTKSWTTAPWRARSASQLSSSLDT